MIRRALASAAIFAVVPAIVLLSLRIARPSDEHALQELRAGFLDPPMDCRPHTYWWWPGNAVTEPEITWQMEQMHAKGIGGVLITSAAPAVYEKGRLAYLSDEYLAMVRHAIRTADRLGMKVYLNFASGWAFGGSWVPPEERSQSLVPASVELKGPQRFAGGLPKFQHAADHRGEIRVDDIPTGEKLVAVVAAREVDRQLDPTTLVDLTAEICGDTLRWQVPAGKWRLMAFWLKHTGQRSHLEHWCVDHFSATAVKNYCDYLGGRFQRAFGDEFGKTLKAVHCDSFELANLPNGIYWSDNLMARFRAHHGYDLTPYLPAIWWEVGDVSTKIRYDVSETLHRVGLDVFFGTFLNWCESHGIQGSMEPIGFPTDIVESAGRAHLPMMEVTPGEKDAVPWFDCRIGPKKYISSGAHLYGRNVVAVEAYTYIHWELYRTTLEELKIATDGFFRCGANKMINHGYSYSPERDVAPSRSIPFAARISHTNVWWDHYPLLAKYIARCSYLLRQGRFVADVAVYSPLANQWALDVLDARRWTRNFDWGGLGRLLVANGYDFDIVNDDVLQNRATIADGKIVVGDLEYRVLVLPNIQALPVKTLEFIDAFARGGGTVIALDRVPENSVGFVNHEGNDHQVRATVRAMFAEPRGQDGTGPRKHGDGQTYFIKTVLHREDVLDRRRSILDPFLNTLRQHVPPDFGIDFAHEGLRDNDGLTFVHRRRGDIDIYFVTNVQDHPSHVPVTFHVTGKAPWIWDPYSGEIAPVLHCQRQPTGTKSLSQNPHGGVQRLGKIERSNGFGACTKIPLRLAAYESTFVLFTEDDGAGRVARSDFDEIVCVTDNRVEARACQNGRYFVTLVRDGRTVTQSATVDGVPAPLRIAGHWTLALEGRDFPKREKRFTYLTSWTGAADTRHFSGTGRYETTFELPLPYLADDLQLRLDLGKVGDVAEVEINGTHVGVRWMRGQTFDVTGAVRAGMNRLVVLVTNTLINRVSAFKRPPPVPERLVDYYGSGTTDYSAHRRGPAGFEPLPPSGLMGPVRITVRKKVTLPAD